MSGKEGFVLKDYTSTESEELTVKKNERVILENEMGEWLKVKKKFQTNRVGLVPADCIEFDLTKIPKTRDTRSTLKTRPTVTVLYDYDAVVEDELTIRVGDIITLITKDPSGWFLGELRGRKGLFPGNYVEEDDGTTPIPPAPILNVNRRTGNRRNNQTKSQRKKMFTVIKNYDAVAEDGLDIRVGEIVQLIAKDVTGVWLVVNSAKRKGLVPGNFLQEVGGISGTTVSVPVGGEKGGYLYGLLTAKGGSKRGARLKEIKHEVSVTDVTARVKSNHEFENDLKNSVEMVYRFPVESSSSIFRVSVKITDKKTGKTRVIESKIKPKEEAKEEYDDAISSGSSSMVMEQISNEIVELSLGNISPATEISVVTEKDFELKIKNGEIRMDIQSLKSKLGILNIPLTKFKAEEMVSFDVKIDFLSATVESVTLSQPKLNDLCTTEKITEKQWNLKTKQKIGNDVEFSVKIKAKNIPVTTWYSEKSSEKEFCHYFSIVPNFSVEERDEIYSELIIIIDRSGSMSGSRMRGAKEAMKLFLHSLDDDSKIKFQIVSFGSKFEKFFQGGPQPLNSDTFRRACEYVESMKANFGGTNMLNPIRDALTSPITPYHSRQVFLLTDGEDHQAQRIVDFVKSHCNTTRFFTFGIGNDINQNLIKNIASRSNGKSVFMKNNDEIEQKVMEQLESALQPCITDFKIKFPKGAKPKSVDNGKIPTVFNGQRVIQCFFSEKEENEVDVSFWCGKREKKLKIQPKIVTGKVGRIVASKRIKFLEGSKGGAKEIKSLGVKFSLLSSQTSFFMEVENDEISIQGEMKSEMIPSFVMKVVKQKQNLKEPTRYRNNFGGYGLNRPRRNNFPGGYGRPARGKVSTSKPKIGTKIGAKVLINDISRGKDSISKFKLRKVKKSEMKRPLSPKSMHRSKGGSSSGSGGGGMMGMMSMLMQRSGRRVMGGGSRMGGGGGGGRNWNKRGGSSRPPPKRSPIRMPNRSGMSSGMKSNVGRPHPPQFRKGLTGRNRGNGYIPSPAPVKRAPPRSQMKRSRDMGDSSNLKEFIYKCDMKGVWTCNKENCRFIEISIDKIKESNMGDIDLWFTAIVVAWLDKRFLKNKALWNLVAKKGKRTLRKKNCENFIEKAREFVKKHWT